MSNLAGTQNDSSARPDESAAARPSVHTELEILIRARYPLIYIVTPEEERAIAEVSRISDSLGKRLLEWSISIGLTRHRSGVDVRAEGRKDTRDPIIALREILGSSEPSIFVLRDFHEFLNNSEVKRRLRDLATLLRSTLSTVVILSPLMRLPDELEKDVTIYDFPLPDRADMQRMLEQISADIKGNPALSMDLSEASREAIIDAAIGLTYNEAENVFAKTLVSAQRLTQTEAPLVYAEKKQVIRKTGLLEYINVSETLSNVGGLDNLKDWIGRRRAAMDPHAAEFGLPSPRGLLLVGVQGCGKSLAAKASANELGFPLVRLDIGRLFSKMVGETESNIRRALSIAEALAPVVLWIDELEKGLSGTGSSDSTDAGTTARLFGTILTWLQEKRAPVFVVATANDIERLPAEVLRKGRFDEIFFVDLPTQNERRQIFSIHLKMRKRDPAKFDLDALAAATEGYSGAEIEQIVIEAMFAVYGRKPDIETSDIIAAAKSLIPISKTMRQSIRARRMWAVGRTVNASSEGTTQQNLEQPDAVDAEKVDLYLQYLQATARVDPTVRMAAEAYLGGFPRKDQEAEKMRLYLKDFERLAERLAGSQGRS